ncbi:hypothetical protein [uncultured Nostoc sp.]|uniref:hypothetical protein n=1 Tax=uncultured Nostoc sp. TaxID=340711 RepID=UPI0035CA78E9
MAIANDDAGEPLKNPEFSATMERADGLIIVAPEYNHLLNLRRYSPTSLKVLDRRQRC